jgi:hypothetical protein
MGTLLKRDGNTIAAVNSISAIEIELETMDVTTLNTVSGFREFIGTLFSGGDVTLDCNYVAGDTDGQAGLKADQAAKTVQSFELVFPAALGASVTFDALVTKFGIGDVKVDGKVGLKVTLKISGEVTINEDASDGLTTDFFTISESAVVSPAPANDDYEYIATVLTAIASVTVTPHGTGVITVNGAAVTSGAASTAIALGAAGSITDITIVQKDTGKVPVSYVIHVFRAAS